MPPAAAHKLDAYDDGLMAAGRGLATARAAATIDLAIYESLAEVEPVWRAFEAEADCTVFQTFDWLSLWQQHIGSLTGVSPAIVVGRDAAGATLFILPLATQRIGFARELVWLGADLCDFNAPLLARRFPAACDKARFLKAWQDALAALQDHPRLHFDLVQLKKMPAMVGGQNNPMLALTVMLNPSGSYITALSEDWDSFYTAKRSSSTRARDRNKRKRLAEFGPLAFVSAAGAEERLASLDALMAQKARSFARMGVADIFARPGHAAFYRALASDARANAFVHISRLDCGERTGAVNIGLTFRDTYYHLQASHADGDLGRFGPGAAHVNDILRYAIARGFKFFDFTIGDEPYKQDWCDGAQPLYDHLAIATGRGACVYLPVVAANRLKRRIKQSPALWKAFSRTRAWIGARAGSPRGGSGTR